MRLLFDQNLSYRLVETLADRFADPAHVVNLGMAAADDAAIWEYAKGNDLVIVTKDPDFHQRSFLFGHPPKVIWVRLGNCSSDDVGTALRKHADDVELFCQDETESLLVLGRGKT